MREWLDLLTLKWLTSEDGKPAFYKIVYLVVLLAFLLITLACILRNIVLDALPWLVAWATLMLFTSHGIKGLDRFVKLRAAQK